LSQIVDKCYERINIAESVKLLENKKPDILYCTYHILKEEAEKTNEVSSEYSEIRRREIFFEKPISSIDDSFQRTNFVEKGFKVSFIRVFRCCLLNGIFFIF